MRDPFLLHEALDASAARDPDRDAFRFEGAGLTYADLVAMANRLARLLIDRGVRRHDRVGIYMTKSLALPVAVYGILKAGAAYVPIDPGSPTARVDFILRDCEIRHLITDPARASRVLRLGDDGPDLASVVVAGDTDASRPDPRVLPWRAVAETPDVDPSVRVVDDDLAYVMYTSGSTGVPKGLMHTHRSGGAYARLSGGEYGVGPDDRLGNHSPLHFDMSTFEFLTGPWFGATSVLIPEEATFFPVRLGELIEEERLTFWYSVPLALTQLLDRGEVHERDCSSLRWVLFGGEPFPPKYLARLMDLWPGARFSNSYGPAEVNQCTAYHLPPGVLDPDAPIPLGRVWPGAEGRVVGDDGEVVQAGETGELWIRGPTAMRGYWRRPDLDAQAFAREEVAPGFEKVFYRTGDLVEEREDGLLVFRGRKDRQVKVRGYRVELEEVETVLAAHPDVAEAAVVPLADGRGGLILGAAVLLRPGGTATGGALRRSAARRLPAYAVPGRIEVRSSLPRTGTGKIDRRAVWRLLDENPVAPDAGTGTDVEA